MRRTIASRRAAEATPRAATILLATLLITSPLVLADNVRNDVSANTGAIRVLAGEPGRVGFTIQATGGDGQNGCNAADGTPARLRFQLPEQVASDVSELVFAECGARQYAHFTAAQAGLFSVVPYVVDAGAGSYDATFARFSLDASAPNAPPVLTVPEDVVEEATGPAGAVVTYAVSAADPDGDAVAVACASSPTTGLAPGSTFPLGATTVACEAPDAAGNVARGTFAVRVVDTTPPELSLPRGASLATAAGDVVAEATGPSGAAVGFAASAYDLVSLDVEPACDAAPGDAFPLGLTTVSCAATDAAGNVAEGSFTVLVRDTTAPTLPALPDLVARATSAAGAPVAFAAVAADLVDGDVPLSCTHASGATFALGTTTVTCTATDAAGNAAGPASFTVAVRYGWSGVLQPVNADGSSTFRLGSTVPVKFKLVGESAPVTDAVVRLHVSKVSGGVTGTELESTSTSAADTGNVFRYDAVAGQYVYNLATKGLTQGTYQLRLEMHDGSLNAVRVSLK